MKTLAFFFALVSSIVLGKEPIKIPLLKVKTREYVAAEITKVDAQYVSVKHESGNARIRILELPEELRIELGYDPVAAGKAKYQEAESNAKIQLNEDAIATTKALLNDKATKTIYITVMSVLPNGLLGTWGSEIIFMETKTERRGFVDESTYEFTARQLGSFSYTSVLGATKNVKKFRDLEWTFFLLKNPGASLSQ